jgi:hypothetical protein
MPVYEFDPAPAPDAEYVAGTLDLLVAGNRGRLLDARRTPVLVTAVSPETGAFEIEVRAFEDAGARWELGLEEVTRFQFDRDGAVATPEEVARLARARQRFEVELVIETDPAACARTADAIASERRSVREALAGAEFLRELDLDTLVRAREAHSGTTALIAELLTDRELGDLDEHFAVTFVSNPRSGELVKGHAVVLAELGVCRYEGPIIRDRRVFETWPKDVRAKHIIFRLALMRELYSALGAGAPTLFRAASHAGPIPPSPPRSFVSATFSREVAEDHFAGGARTTSAVIWRQRTPTERLFMSFLETAALNRQFREAEAILVAGAGREMF